MQGQRRPPAWTRSKSLAELAEHVRRDSSAEAQWLDAATIDAIASGKPKPGPSALVLAGKLLRARDTRPELRREMRAALPGLFGSIGAAAVQDAVAAQSTELTELLSDFEKRSQRNDPIRADAVHAIALQRDDLEAARHALASVRLQSSTAGRELLDPLVWMLEETRGLADRLDAAMTPLTALLRRTLREAAVEAPPELLAMISAGPNPWWLDVVDPALATAPTQYEPQNMALAADGILEVREADRSRSPAARYLARGVLEADAGRVEFYADARGAVWMSLTSNVLSGVDRVEVVWSDAGDTRSIEVGSISPGEWETEIERGVLLAGRKRELGIRAGDRTWLVIAWDEPTPGA